MSTLSPSRRVSYSHPKRGAGGRASITGPVGHQTADALKLLHELQVHQVELELQNVELQDARNQLASLLDKYTDLYDFAPVGYYSLGRKGRILECNLTGSSLLGVERTRLMGQSFSRFVELLSRNAFEGFIASVFSSGDKQTCEVMFRRKSGLTFWVELQGIAGVLPGGGEPCCRLAASDITARHQADEASRHMEALTEANKTLKAEIIRRRTTEIALRKSERHQAALLMESQQMQVRLKYLSQQVLRAQEEERKRISSELHDEIAQTLVGIQVHLETLRQASHVNPAGLGKTILSLQKLTEQSVERIHRFARDLRPTMLDDLGLVPALKAYLKEFEQRSNLGVSLSVSPVVVRLDSLQRVVLYRVVQSALTNVLQHAKASEVRISIRKCGACVRLEVHDNGKAFNVDKELLATRHTRLGLLGMRERVEMVGGMFSVHSSPKQGTTVTADIPVDSGKDTA